MANQTAPSRNFTKFIQSEPSKQHKAAALLSYRNEPKELGVGVMPPSSVTHSSLSTFEMLLLVKEFKKVHPIFEGQQWF